jgi:hypothetical protein
MIKTVLAPIYLRLLVTAEPIDDVTADQAAPHCACRCSSWSADPRRLTLSSLSPGRFQFKYLEGAGKQVAFQHL